MSVCCGKLNLRCFTLSMPIARVCYGRSEANSSFDKHLGARLGSYQGPLCRLCTGHANLLQAIAAIVTVTMSLAQEHFRCKHYRERGAGEVAGGAKARGCHIGCPGPLLQQTQHRSNTTDTMLDINASSHLSSILFSTSSNLNHSMPPLPPPNPRKPRRKEPVQPEKTSRLTPKRQRLKRDSRSQASSAYWDNVSKIWLTKRGLEELDRRTRQARPNPRPNPRPAHPHNCRPLTRSCTAKLQTPQYGAEYTVNPLKSYGSRIAKNIKLYARQGGPDLSELRNVCIAKYLLMYIKANGPG